MNTVTSLLLVMKHLETGPFWMPLILWNFWLLPQYMNTTTRIQRNRIGGRSKVKNPVCWNA